ncbi:MAG: glycosyltransferase family 4 protein [Planctomycetota bacterium]|jgi:glycosyltransferase involved in cell wall biosynthesis
MRVVHIITRMIVGGAQENTRYNCLDLIRQHGDSVTLITGPAHGAEGSLLEAAKDKDLEAIVVPSLIRSIVPWHDIRAYRQLRALIQSIEPDVVHTHSAKGGMLGRAAAWSLRVPCVVHTVHGAPFHPFQSAAARRVFIACERWAAKRCHHIISVADAMTDLMVQADVAPPSKFTTIYSGMEVDPFLHSDRTRQQVREELGLGPEHVVVGKIARLFHLKGHEYVLAAAKSVVREHPNVRFLWVGDGVLRESYEQQIQEAGLQTFFILTGLQRPQRIPALVGAMDILVHTSLREGLARALPQALIAGKPVISYDVDGAREVVIDGETGLLLPPKSIEPLSQAINRLVADKPLRMKMGATGQLRFTDLFRHQTMTRRIRELYQRVLSGTA